MSEDAGEAGRTRLLIAEDDEAQLRTLSDIMEAEGFEVLVCATGAEALEHLDGGDVDVAVIDLRLPDTGETELLARLAVAADDVPVIVHTGHASLASAKQAVNSGAFAYVEKGRDPGELVQCAHRAVATRLKRRAEEALRTSEAKYRRLYESMREASAAADMDGRIIECNPAFTALLGYSDEEVRNLTRKAITPERWHEAEARVLAEQVLVRGYSDVYEKEYVRKDGAVIPVELRTFLVRDESGDPMSIWAIIRDVTERKQLEEQLRQSQKMDAVGRLAGGVAHDFRNQLTVIKWCADRLLRRSLVSDEGRDEVEEIVKAADRSAALTGELLAFSRREVLRPAPTDLCNVVADMEGTLQRMIGEDICLSITPCKGICRANLDPSRLQQAVMNLVVNARDAMPNGGSLTVRLGCVRLSRRAARAHRAAPGRYATIVVTDTGVGMDEEIRRRAFEPFFTTREGGESAGLGLSMVYGFVKQSGGFIEIESLPGQGSTFRLCFPRVADKPAPARPRQAGKELPCGSGTVLLAEDEAPLRRKLSASLTDAGYTVLRARNATEALRLGRRHGGPIDVLVTDVVMPGMSGVELAKRVRRAFPGIRVLFISGYLGEDLAERGLDVDREDVLRKPFDEGELLGKVRGALAAPGETARKVEP